MDAENRGPQIELPPMLTLDFTWVVAAMVAQITHAFLRMAGTAAPCAPCNKKVRT